jgi:hypothetical protein
MGTFACVYARAHAAYMYACVSTHVYEVYSKCIA